MPPGRRLFPQLVRLDAVTSGSPVAEDTATSHQLPPPVAHAPESKTPWFLGLDIGTSGLSAVLLNQATNQLIPLFWRQPDSSRSWFRWPIDSAIGLNHDSPQASLATTSAEAAVLCQLKSALALPLRQDMGGVLESSERLEPAYRPLSRLLETLGPNRSAESMAAAPWVCGGLGCDNTQLATAMGQLCGVGVSYPAGWPNRYQVNIQSAILEAGLVSQSNAIYAVEEAIAAAMACLRIAPSAIAKDTAPAIRPPYTLEPEGVAFVLNAGASTTELALLDLTALAQSHAAVLASRTLAYAGQALDQDILVHHLYPQLQASSRPEVEQLLSLLQLNHGDHPQLGQPDVIKRLRLHLRLCSSGTGQQLLAIAQQIKHDLQTMPQSAYTIAQHHGQMTQDTFGHHILLPYIRALTQQVQSLIEQAALSPQSVQHIICSGGTASMRVVHLWARQCFPNADLKFAPSIAMVEAQGSAALPSAWLGSQVGYGLARLPLFAQSASKPAENAAQ